MGCVYCLFKEYFMKKLKLLSAISCGALLVLAGCGSAPKQQQQAAAQQP
jgi:PBP1b-binding outer membrane lipoprotein LpoB